MRILTAHGKLETVAGEYGKGNLVFPVFFREKDELAPLKSAFIDMVVNIGSSLGEILDNII